MNYLSKVYAKHDYRENITSHLFSNNFEIVNVNIFYINGLRKSINISRSSSRGDDFESQYLPSIMNSELSSQNPELVRESCWAWRRS